MESDHEKIKPFKCNKCDYKTAHKSHLKKHIDSVHEGIKPYKCNICDYRTAEQSKLKIHTNSVHEKIKPFKCQICTYDTVNKTHLKKHIESVHEKKTNENNKSAKEISNAVLSKGKKTKNCVKNKTSSYLFCKNCNQTFENKDQLNVHSCLKSKKGTQKVMAITIAIKQEPQEILKSLVEDSQNDQKVSFQSIKVEPSTLEQSQQLETVDPLIIHEFKEEKFEKNEAIAVQDLAPLFIKQDEVGASEFQNEQDNEMIDIKEEWF